MYDVKFKRQSDGVTKLSYTDWGLLVAPVTISAPTPQTYYVEIVGREGSLDLSEALGGMHYKDREISLVFTTSVSMKDIYSKYSQVCNFLHGQKVDITLPDDSNFYYSGRCSIGNLARARRTGQIEVKATIEPYKYKNNVTTVTKTIGTTPDTVTLTNLKMATIPLITTTDSVKFEYGSATYDWEAGEHYNTSILLKEGDNVFTFIDDSSGSVTFEYQEGKL